MDYLFAPERHQTDSFVLRSYRPGDGAALAASLNTSYAHLRAFLAWAQHETSERSAEQRARYFRAKWLLAEDFVVAVESVDGAAILGGCGFHLRNGPLAAKSAEIGMWISGDAAGCGLGTRVLVELLRWGFDEWPWEQLTWLCDPRNVASKRVAEKAGMALAPEIEATPTDGEGTPSNAPGTLCYAARRSSWAAPRDVR